jgi:hypothetical protein
MIFDQITRRSRAAAVANDDSDLFLAGHHIVTPIGRAAVIMA